MEVMSTETSQTHLPAHCSPTSPSWDWHGQHRACLQHWRVPCLCSALQDGIGKENTTHRSLVVPFNLALRSPPLNMSLSTTSTCFLEIPKDCLLSCLPGPHEATIKPPRQEKGVRGAAPPQGAGDAWGSQVCASLPAHCSHESSTFWGDKCATQCPEPTHLPPTALLPALDVTLCRGIHYFH